MVKSFLSGGTAYPGGKGKAFQHIINLMPPHRRYVESHLGAGSVLRHKRAAAENIGVEIDARVVRRWRREPPPGVRIIQGDAMTVLPRLDLREDDLVYCDPPYLPQTRRRSRTYRHDCTSGDHERLLALLRSLSCQVILSGYQSELYDAALEGWSRTQFTTQTHAGVKLETVWTNYVPGPQLHDYSYVGATFRERERLKRRIDTLSQRLIWADDLERNAVLAALAEACPGSVLAAAERAR